MVLTCAGPGATVHLRGIETRVAGVSDFVVEKEAIRTKLFRSYTISAFVVLVTLFVVRKVLHTFWRAGLTQNCEGRHKLQYSNT
ncbi:hypothetical protein E2C01_012008 [Portunus trituberculatus]|uniref:Uncharacterized protein n=1 Tax=Portunus trituberculatus TaxID=210409 RepID=A0A5B7DCP4_PORTR|nr:hypothetical protein [Portunus trituberculatus]